jgi:hypothetical protein
MEIGLIGLEGDRVFGVSLDSFSLSSIPLPLREGLGEGERRVTTLRVKSL